MHLYNQGNPHSPQDIPYWNIGLRICYKTTSGLLYKTTPYANFDWMSHWTEEAVKAGFTG